MKTRVIEVQSSVDDDYPAHFRVEFCDEAGEWKFVENVFDWAEAIRRAEAIAIVGGNPFCGPRVIAAFEK